MPGTPTIAALWIGGGRGKEEAAPDAECSCQAGASPQHMHSAAATGLLLPDRS